MVASAITHFIVGASLALPAIESRSIRKVLKPWAIPVTAGLLAVAPDLDTIAMRIFDIPYRSFWGHRGFFRSPFFLLLFCAALAALASRRHGWRTWAWLTVVWAGCAITHPLLDMLTDGGSGVMALYPFSTGRYFFPWHPIHVSPLGIARFFSRAGYILKSEMPFDLAALVCGTGLLACLRPPTKQ
jgi:inner membrane protein